VPSPVYPALRKFLIFTLTVFPPLPKTYRGALKDPNWHVAMVDEYSALLSNNTWDLVDPPCSANIVNGSGLFDIN
jgi:hypothetical protein